MAADCAEADQLGCVTERGGTTEQPAMKPKYNETPQENKASPHPTHRTAINANPGEQETRRPGTQQHPENKGKPETHTHTPTQAVGQGAAHTHPMHRCIGASS